ncbi:MAG: hypothetical protein LBD02_10845 [Christensenellaceae bacterium]|jgi:hypothetical protein|nr:hypothetical protein [Christensenellaceae bacterium]
MRMPRKAVFAFALLFALFAGLLTPTPAWAAQAGVSLSAAPVENAEGGVYLDVRLSLVGEGSLISNFELYYKSQNIFRQGSIAPGEYTLRTLPLGERYADLPSSFQITLIYLDFDGLTQASKSFQVYMPGTSPDLAFTRGATPEGGSVKLSYSVKNIGDVPLSDIELFDPLFGAQPFAHVDSLDLNQSQTIEKEFQLTQDSESAPLVQYRARGGDEIFEKRVDPLPLKLNKPELKISLKADLTTIHAGDRVTLTCNIENSGNVAFQSAKITDQGGNVLEENLALEVGKMKSVTMIVQPDESTEYSFTVSGPDANGQPYAAKSNAVLLTVQPSAAALQGALELGAQAEKAQIAKAEEVRFELSLLNGLNEPVSSLQIKDERGNVLASLQSLPPGRQALSLPVLIEETRSVIFHAEGYAADGSFLSAVSLPIDIELDPQSLLDGSASGSPPPAVAMEPSTLSPMTLILIIFMLLFLLACIVVVVMLQVRAWRRAKSRRAAAKRRDEAYAPATVYSHEEYYDDSPEADEEAQREISRYAREYAPRAGDVESELDLPYPLAKDETSDDAATVYQSPRRQEQGQNEPRTRQNFPKR